MKKTLCLLLVALVVGAGCFLGYRQIMPTRTPAGFTEATKTLDQALPGPDLDLMLSNLKAMSSQVHSVETPGIEITRNHLKAQLTGMGYTYEVEDYPLTIDEVLTLETERKAYRGKPLRETRESILDYAGLKPDDNDMVLQNVVVTLDAPNTDRAVIFMAHMDSVKMGPGTFDDTVSCVALLEALRMLKNVTPTRDLIFLFTDGEEQGMLGAAMYTKAHPEMKARTDLVINVEARGNTGAVLMFETTPNNLGMVRAYNEGTDHPVSFSIASSVYHIMSNDTDLTWFMMAGYPGMNFSVIEGAEVYHTAQDNYEGFNRNSAAHYLTTVTSLVKHMATADLSAVPSGQDAVFFPLFEGNLVVISQTTSNVLAFLSAAAAIGLIVLLAMKKRLHVKHMLLSLGAQLGLLLVSAGVCFGIIRIVASSAKLVSANDFLRFGPAPIIFFTLAAAFVALNALLYGLLARKCDGLSLQAGVMPLFALLAVATTFVFPAANYLFSLPLLLMVCASLLTLIAPKLSPLWFAITGFLCLLLFVPLTYLVFVALNLSMSYAAVALFMIPFSCVFATAALMIASNDCQAQTSAFAA